MADNMEQYCALLDKARVIHAENAKVQEWRRARGEMFNTFRVLHHWGEEVTVHSRFIAELLNPKGSHGCGAQLLKAFCNTAGIEGFDYEGAKVEVEKAFDDGRMDIVITQEDSKKVIVIENKIYADDGPLQLQRYKKYCESYGDGNWTLLYLTLDGREPSEESTGKHTEGQKAYWEKIAYNNRTHDKSNDKDIVSWLEECARIAMNKENVRVGVNEYLDLIKRITGDSMDEKMQKELDALLMTGDNLALAAEMSWRIAAVKQRMLKDIMQKLGDAFKQGGRFVLEAEKFGSSLKNNTFDKYENFSLHNKAYDDVGLYIAFQAQDTNLMNFIGGITRRTKGTPHEKEIWLAVKSKLSGGEMQSDWWALYENLNEYRNLNAAAIADIRNNPDAFYKFIRERALYYSSILDEALKTVQH